MKPKAAGMSDVGRCRKANQDQFLVDMPLGVYAIADGMGGHAAGEVASELAISASGGVAAIRRRRRADRLRRAGRRSTADGSQRGQPEDL